MRSDYYFSTLWEILTYFSNNRVSYWSGKSSHLCISIVANKENVTSIYLHNSGTMTVHGQEVHAEKLSVAIKEFCKW